MRKILSLEEDTPFRDELGTQLRQLADAELVIASDTADAVARIQDDYWAAVIVDTSLVADDLPHVLAAVRRASLRPVVLLVTKDPKPDLDPDLVSLVIRKPYEVGMVVGILLAAVTNVSQPTTRHDDVAKLPPS